jgi:hypothetical protein
LIAQDAAAGGGGFELRRRDIFAAGGHERERTVVVDKTVAEKILRASTQVPATQECRVVAQALKGHFHENDF